MPTEQLGVLYTIFINDVSHGNLEKNRPVDYPGVGGSGEGCPHLLPFAFGGVEVVHVLAAPFVQLNDPAPADRSSLWESGGRGGRVSGRQRGGRAMDTRWTCDDTQTRSFTPEKNGNKKA